MLEPESSGRSRAWHCALLALCAALLGPLPSGAQGVDPAEAYPARPARVIIPFVAGGSTDIQGRIVGEVLARELGQPFLPVNVVGAGGTIGALQVVKSAPDGHTLMIGTPGTIQNSPNMSRTAGHDPLRDCLAVSSVWSQPALVIVRRGR